MMRKIFAAVLCVCFGSTAPAAAQNQDRFLAVDLSAGILVNTAPPDDPEAEDKWALDGWDVGGTVRLLPWLGIATDVGRYKLDNVSTGHFLVGPHVTTRYGNPFWSRVFAHALAGRATASQSG